MRRVIEYLKERCSQEEIAELVKELSAKEETKANDVPRTWEEYVNIITNVYYIDKTSEIKTESYSRGIADSNYDRNTLPTKELAESFLAMMQLMSLRKAWIKDWEPDWKDINISKYGIVFEECEFQIDIRWGEAHHLSFPTKEMAQDFLNCFKDLIEKAKVLI